MSQNDTEADDSIEFQTDRGAGVTVTARSGTLFVSVDSPAVTIDRTSAFVDSHKGMDVLNLGTHRVQGNKERLQIPIDEYKGDIEQLREDSKSDEPLAYEVIEVEKSARTDGWGPSTVTRQRLKANKSYAEMTEREQELSRKVDTDRVPEDAETGDVLSLDDLLGDTRTDEEKDQDALDEAAETGEEVVIKRTTTGCNDSHKECNLDHVSRVATPDGEIETRRTHTY